MSPIIKLAASRALINAGLGLGVATLENETLLHDADPNLQHINQFLGALTGGTTPATGIGKHILKAWVPKQMAMFGLNAYDKSVKQQLPIANTQLDTAVKALETAKIQADAAKNISTSDIARLGLAGAGIGAAGGLGYYLYNTLGPGKKKPSPRVSVTLAGAGKGDSTSIEGEMDTLELSKRLNLQLRRDAKRQLRDETKANTRSERRKPQDDQDEENTPELKGILREKPQESTLSSILNLLRN